MAAIVLALGLLLGSALADPPKPTPDSPGVNYWYLHVDGPGPQVGDMDPRLQEIADAFGLGDYGTCRRLASTLLDSAKDPTLRAEAAGFVVQSHLAEGDFASARAAAERLNDQDALTRVNGIEADYKAKVGRLQRIVATTTDPAEAARAQFLMARAHQQVGRLELAEESYWTVVRHYASRPEAGEALQQVVEIHCAHGNSGQAVAACERALELAPDSVVGATACETAVELWLAQPAPRYEELRQRLRTIAETYPGTQAADMARFGIGHLYAAQGVPEPADGEWSDLVLDRYGTPIANRARVEVAELRYAEGERASRDGDSARAAHWWERLRPDAHVLGTARAEHALFSLAQAYRELGEWAKAAQLFRLLALPGGDLEELALFELGESELEAGRNPEALEAFSALVDRFGGSAFAPHCRHQISVLEQAREDEEALEARTPEGGEPQ